MIAIKDKYLAYLEKHRHDAISHEALFLKPYQILRDSYRDEDLRKNGIFFSSPHIANKLVGELGSLRSSDKVIDPCCGAGDLLLAYVTKLRKFTTLEKFLTNWSKIIYANDLNADFIDVTNIRLIMAAFFMCEKKIHN